MNVFDDAPIDTKSYSYLDLLALDKWISFTPSFTSLTVVGATTYTGRLRVQGRSVEFQVTLLAATSIASTAGTAWMALPITSKGIAGFGIMQNLTTNVAVGDCVVDAVNSRLYLPSQTASGNKFSIFGKCEI